MIKLAEHHPQLASLPIQFHALRHVEEGLVYISVSQAQLRLKYQQFDFVEMVVSQQLLPQFLPVVPKISILKLRFTDLHLQYRAQKRLLCFRGDASNLFERLLRLANKASLGEQGHAHVRESDVVAGL